MLAEPRATSKICRNFLHGRTLIHVLSGSSACGIPVYVAAALENVWTYAKQYMELLYCGRQLLLPSCL